MAGEESGQGVGRLDPVHEGDDDEDDARGDGERNEDAVREWNLYLDLVASKNPGEADIARKRVRDLGGTPKR